VHGAALSWRRSAQHEDALEAGCELQGEREFHVLQTEVSEGDDVDERAFVPDEEVLALDAQHVGMDGRFVRSLQVSQLDARGKSFVPSGHQNKGTGAVERKLVTAEITAIAIEEAEGRRRLWHVAVLIRDKK